MTNQNVSILVVDDEPHIVLSIEFLLRYLQRHTTFVFVGYRVALGLVIIALLIAGRISAN